MNDEQLRRLLQSAVPRVDETSAPHDAWASIADRVNSQPSWSLFDTALAAGIAITLLLIPETLFLIALHL